MKPLYTIGIDEAGRGALAGPVVVAAVAIPEAFTHRVKHLPTLKDSKKLSYRSREVWHQYIKEYPLVFSQSARIYQRRIDRTNINKSANLAASRALQKLLDKLDLDQDSIRIMLDGNLYPSLHLDLPYKVIVRGDEKIVSIKMASIVAKVVRDRYMETIHNRYPQYDFAKHKGYGTQEHIEALREHGISDVHRLTYLKGYPNLKLIKH